MIVEQDARSLREPPRHPDEYTNRALVNIRVRNDHVHQPVPVQVAGDNASGLIPSLEREKSRGHEPPRRAPAEWVHHG